MPDDERLLGGYTGRMLAVTALAWAALQLARFAVPPLLPEIRADLGLSLADAGVALTVLQGVYAVFQYPSGRLSDEWSRATLLAPSFVVLGVGCLLLGGAVGLWTLLAGMAVFGVGKGLYAIPSRALLSDLFVERRGRALGVFSAGTDLGGVLASGAAVVAIAVASWRVVFAPVAVLLFVLLVVFVAWNREPYVVRRSELESIATLRRLLATPRQRWTIVAFVCFYFMVNGVLNFLPEYLRVVKDFSPALASGAFALLFAFGLAVKPASGALSDRFRRRTVAVAGLLLAAAALAAVVVADSLVAVAAAIVVFAFGYKAQFPVIDAILLDAAPDADAGADLGAARTFFLGIGSLGPAFVGVVADWLNFAVAFAALAALLVAAAAILLAVGR
ncbi:MFS transporter [Natronomonas marina]|uniref:MFS transporter n=1 Tax=Natronomonas marina TaxID=2961939 RepID=UPI0020C9F8E3|nr:MFS transporter [Natronomonas marina]